MNNIRTDEETLRAVCALQGNPFFERILWWLRGSFEKEMGMINEAENAYNGGFRAGMVGQLHEILKNIHDARMNLDLFTKLQKEVSELGKVK